jgi:1,4-alpha-glucan branching enzyme
MRAANRALYAREPGTFTVAEESTSWPGVSAPAYDEAPRTALGFGFKWNMGWMHDTLKYMAREPVHRKHHHAAITFGLVYAFDENFVLPISHDEVVHGKGSMLTKMPGDDWQKFANLRTYYAMMWGYPGKKLLFMGQEFAQRAEWSEERALDWDLLNSSAHDGVRKLVRDLNRLYREKRALHARDCEPEGFRWLVQDDAENSVFVWMRSAPGAPPIVVIVNMTPVARMPYRVPLPHDGRWREVLNSDAHDYWGSGLGNLGGVVATGGHADVTLPPLATVMLEWEPAS